MKKLVLFTLSLAATLPLLSARPAHAAGTTVTAVAQAVGDNDPGVALFLDGKVQGDPKAMVQKLHDTFAGAQYIVTDQGQLILGKANGNSLAPLVPPMSMITYGNDNSYMVVHVRAQNVILDGVVYRFSDDPSKGGAVFDLVQLDAQGNSACAHIEQSLAWQTQGGNGGNQGNNQGNPFGF